MRPIRCYALPYGSDLRLERSLPAVEFKQPPTVFDTAPKADHDGRTTGVWIRRRSARAMALSPATVSALN